MVTLKKLHHVLNSRCDKLKKPSGAAYTQYVLKESPEEENKFFSES